MKLDNLQFESFWIWTQVESKSGQASFQDTLEREQDSYYSTVISLFDQKTSTQ